MMAKKQSIEESGDTHLFVNKDKDPFLKQLEEVKKKRDADAEKKEKEKPRPLPVSAGPIDNVPEMILNPSRDKMLEFTDLDLNQTRLIPQLVVLDDMWNYCEQVSVYNYDMELYTRLYEQDIPVLPDMTEQYVFTLAQCRKSLKGANLKAGVDLVLADMEAKAGGGVDGLGEDADF